MYICAIIVYNGKGIFNSTVFLKLKRKKVYNISIQYKINVISALKEAGYSTYKLRKEKILAESTLQKFRNNEMVSWENISTICKLLNCQPGDLMEYVPDTQKQT